MSAYREYYKGPSDFDAHVEQFPYEVVVVLGKATSGFITSNTEQKILNWLFAEVDASLYDTLYHQDTKTKNLIQVLWFTHRDHAIQFKLRFG